MSHTDNHELARVCTIETPLHTARAQPFVDELHTLSLSLWTWTCLIGSLSCNTLNLNAWFERSYFEQPSEFSEVINFIKATAAQHKLEVGCLCLTRLVNEHPG